MYCSCSEDGKVLQHTGNQAVMAEGFLEVNPPANQEHVG